MDWGKKKKATFCSSLTKTSDYFSSHRPRRSAGHRTITVNRHGHRAERVTVGELLWARNNITSQEELLFVCFLNVNHYASRTTTSNLTKKGRQNCFLFWRTNQWHHNSTLKFKHRQSLGANRQTSYNTYLFGLSIAVTYTMIYHLFSNSIMSSKLNVVNMVFIQ